MAIKKGAFDLYAKERQLPHKDQTITKKSTHIFESNIGSQSVHNRFTGAMNKESQDAIITSEQRTPSNGSQLVHEKPIDAKGKASQGTYTKGASNPLNIGSQSVHNRFTETPRKMNQGAIITSDQRTSLNGSQSVHGKPTDVKEQARPNTHITDASNPLNIGSQSVHKQFTSTIDTKNQDAIITSEQCTSLNGSQSVHNRFTNTIASDDQETVIASKQHTSSNGSQSVHERFTDIGNENIIPIEIQSDTVTNPSLNGSQTVQERFTTLMSEPDVQPDNLSLHTTPLNGSQLIYNEESEITEPCSSINLSKLVGNQRDIVLSFYKNMKNNHSTTTQELTLDEIALISGVNKKSLKNTLFRMTSTNLIIRIDQKVGRGGWVKYQINPELLHQIKKIEITYTLKTGSKSKLF